MIVNLDRFIAAERPGWDELERRLSTLAKDPWRRMSLAEMRALERLYQRAAADLARLATFSAAPETRRHLERLVARGHAEIHGGRAEEGRRFKPLHWLRVTFPEAWRRQARPFWFAFAIMMTGAVFGGAATGFDPAAKSVLVPFDSLRESAAQRVAREEREQGERLVDRKASFSGQLMTHNTRVTLMAMALGMTAGLGTLVLMFYNGVGLGAVAVDYLASGQGTFLFGWLLPHGVVEIPAMLVGGQAGFILATAIIGRSSRLRLGLRLRAVAPDVATLCLGAGVMLVWAGLIEAFFSQYHEPVLPYAAKIAFGVAEAALLFWYLGFCGRTRASSKPA